VNKYVVRYMSLMLTNDAPVPRLQQSQHIISTASQVQAAQPLSSQIWHGVFHTGTRGYKRYGPFKMPSCPANSLARGGGDGPHQNGKKGQTKGNARPVIA